MTTSVRKDFVSRTVATGTSSSMEKSPLDLSRNVFIDELLVVGQQRIHVGNDIGLRIQIELAAPHT